MGTRAITKTTPNCIILCYDSHSYSKHFKKVSLWKQDKGNKACVHRFAEAITKNQVSPIPFDDSISSLYSQILFLFILFALVKAIVPRYRYDQLMKLGWKIFLPLSLIWVVITAAYLLYFDLLPAQI